MAAQGNGESKGWIAELTDLHLKGMKPEFQRTLIFLFRGLSRADIATREGVQESTVKSWVLMATAEISARLAQPHPNTAELRGGWVILHRTCCLEAAWKACA